MLIVNLTDAPGYRHRPTQVDIYNKTLDPGGTLKIPADLVDKKIRALELEGLISIGPIPSWYTNSKMPRGRTLSKEERTKRITPKKPVVEKLRGHKAALVIVDEVALEKVVGERGRR